MTPFGVKTPLKTLTVDHLAKLNLRTTQNMAIIVTVIHFNANLPSRLIAMATATLIWFASAPKVTAVGIMVNEYKNAADNGTITNKMAADEFVEFVLTQNATASELATLTFGSTNGTTSALQGVFSFDLTTLNTVLTNSGQSQFLAGTIIVVKGNNLGAENLTYAPTVANASNNDAWSIELVAGSGAKDNAETVVDGNLAVDNQGAVIWIASGVPTSTTDTSKFIDAIGHDNAPGTIANAVISQFGANHILSQTIGAPKSVYNTADGVVSLATSTSSTMGSPNGGSNTTWLVDSLRAAAPEPSRSLLTFGGLAAILLQRRRRYSTNA